MDWYDQFLEGEAQKHEESDPEDPELVFSDFYEAAEFAEDNDILTEDEIEIAVGFAGKTIDAIDRAVFYKTGALSILDYYFRD